MSTRSNIIIKKKDNSVNAVYCHCDGYLSYNGKILLNNYNTTEKVNALINGGNMSSLAKTLGDTSFYTKRGDELFIADYKNLKEYLDNVDTLFIEYIYMWVEEKEKWYFVRTSLYSTPSENAFTKLTNMQIKKESEE